MSFLNLVFPKTNRLLQPKKILKKKNKIKKIEIFHCFSTGLQIQLNKIGLYVVLQPIAEGEVLWMDACTVKQSKRDRRVAINALGDQGKKTGKKIRDDENLLWHSTFNEEARNRGYYRVPDRTAKLNYLWRPSSRDRNGKERNVDLIFMDNHVSGENDQSEFSCLLVAQAKVALVKGDILCGPRPDDDKTYPGSQN